MVLHNLWSVRLFIRHDGQQIISILEYAALMTTGMMLWFEEVLYPAQRKVYEILTKPGSAYSSVVAETDSVCDADAAAADVDEVDSDCSVEEETRLE